MIQVQIRTIFSFLDRSFLINSSTFPQLNDMAIRLFRSIICENEEIEEYLYKNINALVYFDREKRDTEFDSQLLKASIMMLLVLDLYKKFEPLFLDSSRQFLKSQECEGLDLRTYIARCVGLLEREVERCDAYNFDSGTKRALLLDAQSVLVEQRSTFLLDEARVSGLLEVNDIESLKSLYDLLKCSNIQGQLKIPWEAYIKKFGSAIVCDLQKGDDMVVRLLELKRSLEVIIRDAFNKDETFKFAMREAYSNFINDRKNTTAWGTGNSKVGEVIAKYIDLLLRGGLKAVPRSLTSDAKDRDAAEKLGHASTGDEDAELDRQLEQGLELFRFIEGKDVFEAFYKKDLARRLLMARSASQDAERNMLTKLKSECGSNFTHNLEQMFKDQELSKDEMISYRQSLSNTSKTTMDLQVSVLSAAAWPTYPDVTVNLPDEVARHIEKFDRHYKNKHTGRRLTWKHALSHSIVKANFPKGTKELVVSGFQAIVLVLFNDLPPGGALAYTDIQNATGLVDAELIRTLQSLACAKVRPLNKHPKSRDVAKTDTFTVNTAFIDPKFRIKINQIQLKETKEENKETHERVALDRQYETQAAIVRIMKSRKVMTHQLLVAEVIQQTKGRGAVEVGEIKKNIEKYDLSLCFHFRVRRWHHVLTIYRLIEKEYMEREDDGSYTYLA
jgi:cullin-4